MNLSPIKNLKLTLFNVQAIVWCIAFPALTNAASFDCAKASTSVEKLICSDDQLSRLDDELAEIYSSAVNDTKGGGKVRNSQREWLVSRNHCGLSPYAKDESWLLSCIKGSYERRLESITLIPFELHECAFPSRSTDLGMVYSKNGGEWKKIFDVPRMRTMLSGHFRYIYYHGNKERLFVEAWQHTDFEDLFAGCIEIKDKAINKGAYDFKFTPADDVSIYFDMKLPDPAKPKLHRVRIPFYFIHLVL